MTGLKITWHKQFNFPFLIVIDAGIHSLGFVYQNKNVLTTINSMMFKLGQWIKNIMYI